MKGDLKYKQQILSPDSYGAIEFGINENGCLVIQQKVYTKYVCAGVHGYTDEQVELNAEDSRALLYFLNEHLSEITADF